MAGLLAIAASEAIRVLADEAGASFSSMAESSREFWASISLPGTRRLIEVFPDYRETFALREGTTVVELRRDRALLVLGGLGGVKNGWGAEVTWHGSSS
jgi:hypothetical protein